MVYSYNSHGEYATNLFSHKFKMCLPCPFRGLGVKKERPKTDSVLGRSF
jgi:hypothetical protein